MWKTIVEISMGWGLPGLFLVSLVCTFISLFYSKKEKAAITSIIFLFSLCLYMIVGVAMIRIEYSFAWINIIIYIFCMLFVVVMIGALSMLQIVFLQMKQDYEIIGRTWRVLKCGSMIYFFLNAIFWRYTFQAFHDMFRAEAGDIIGGFVYLGLIMVSPYVWVPFGVSVLTGYCGYTYINYLIDQTEGDKKDLIIAGERQFIPILDYISMRKIWKKYKKNE